MQKERTQRRGVRLVHLRCPMLTKFGMWVGLSGMFLTLSFRKIDLKFLKLWAVEFSFLLLKRLIAYTTAYSYGTSRDY